MEAAEEDCHRVLSRDLWAIALQSLPKEESENLVLAESGSKLAVLDSLLKDVVQQRDECEKKKLKFEIKGRQVILRDLADKAITWIDKFKEIGDVAVNFDPVHAALPWAGIRFLLQVAVVETKQRAAMLIAVEKVLSIISRCKIIEILHLDVETLGQAIGNLRSALVEIYSHILKFLATARRLKSKGYARMVVHGLFNPEEAEKFVKDCEKMEWRVDSEARNCESLYTREAYAESANRADVLHSLLLSFDQPLIRLDSRVGLMFTRLEESRQSKILQWISLIPYKDGHMTASRGRTEGTGRWLLHHPKFCQWRRSSSSSMLWLHGFPGAGKTKLVSTVVDDLVQSYNAFPGDEALAYFYCDRNRSDYRDLGSIMSSLVRQLTLSRDEQSVDASMVQMFEQRQKTGFASSKLSFEEVEAELRRLAQLHPQTTLVVDALDECDKETRTRFVQYLHDLIAQSSTLIKIFISSRPDPDIRLQLANGTDLEIRAVDNHQDIVKYVASTITNNSSPLFWREKISYDLKRRVRDTLISNAEGMFQWVALQIRQLHTLSRGRDIEMRLGKLPKTLKEAHDEILDRIQSAEGSAPEVADRAFQWVMRSEAPLTPKLLVAAVCQDPATDELDDVDIDIDFVLEACQSLLTVNSSGYVCRFSHLSVQEYLENHFDKQRTDSLLAMVCLTVLNDPVQRVYEVRLEREMTLSALGSKDARSVSETSSEVLERGSQSGKSDISEDGNTERPSKSPKTKFSQLWKYASKYWLVHVQNCGLGPVDGRLIALLKKFLGSPAESAQAFQDWWEEAFDARSRIPTIYHSRMFPSDFAGPGVVPSVAQAIVMFGFQDILSDWWDCIDFGVQNHEGENLLIVASRGGCPSTVKALLDRGLDINAGEIGRGSGTALYVASYSKNLTLVRMLLKSGADVNKKCGIYGSALQIASRHSTLAIVKELIDAGADVNLQEGFYCTALQAASAAGISNNNASTVRALLNAGADVNIQRGRYISALRAAVKFGHNDIARMLLDAGADVNQHDGHADILRLAARYDKEMTELLLEAGADPNIRGGDFDTALHAAASFGCPDVVELLLQNGAFDYDGVALRAALEKVENKDTHEEYVPDYEEIVTRLQEAVSKK